MSYQQDYQIFKKLVSICHGSVNISGGIKFQNLIYNSISDSNKHDNVYHEYAVSLIKETGEEDRSEHKVDILCEDSDVVLAHNSKGKSFNNTETGYGLLQEYRNYKKALEKEFPGKKVEYIILKDEYNPNDSKMVKYNYLAKHGIPVYNTKQYLTDNYGVDFDVIEDERQKRAVKRCRDTFAKNAISEEELNTVLKILEKLK
jgi:hypothetical protein